MPNQPSLVGSEGKRKRTLDKASMGVVKVGDQWEFQSNFGYLGRQIRSISRNGTVSYINSAGYFRQCSMATFKRWCFGAALTSATNWDNR